MVRNKDIPVVGEWWQRVNTGEYVEIRKVNEFNRVYIRRDKASEHEALYEYPIRFFLNHFRKVD